MDRFIVCALCNDDCVAINLKSNMDRFIGKIVGCVYDFAIYLKSNMDRFIDLVPYALNA